MPELPAKNPAFAVLPTDPKDVSWALTTADACWKRGERSDALRWLRRAVESASEAEQDERALSLAKVAADLATHIGSIAPPPNPSIRPSALPRPTSVAPPAPKPAASTAARAPHAPPLKEAPKKTDRKSITNEAAKSRAPQAGQASKPAERSAQKPSELPAPKKRSGSRVDKGEAATRVSTTDEIDSWPTDVVSGAEIPASLTLATPVVRDVPFSQAVKVMVWRDADGSLRVGLAGKGTPHPRLAVEAILVASEPSTPLAGLFNGER